MLKINLQIADGLGNPIDEEILTLEPIVTEPKTKIMERTIMSGNKGYIVLDKKNVYLGIETTLTEEASVK